jgi:hypothetical protein
LVPVILKKLWPRDLVYSNESICVKIGNDINFNPYSKFLGKKVFKRSKELVICNPFKTKNMNPYFLS